MKEWYALSRSTHTLFFLNSLDYSNMGKYWVRASLCIHAELSRTQATVAVLKALLS